MRDLICLPVVTLPSTGSLSLTQNLSIKEFGVERGMCVRYPASSFAYVFTQSDSCLDQRCEGVTGSRVPFPVAYFPLEGGSLNSWPFPVYTSDRILKSDAVS